MDQLLSDSSSSFGKLLRRAGSVNRLSRTVSKLLDEDLRPHCELANARDGKLVFVCSSAAWSSRLLMQAPEILQSLQDAGITEFQKVEAKTRPGHYV